MTKKQLRTEVPRQFRDSRAGPTRGRRRTDTMLATSGVGFGRASSGQNVAAGGLWENSASAPLACLLYAASPLGNNLGHALGSAGRRHPRRSAGRREAPRRNRTTLLEGASGSPAL